MKDIKYECRVESFEAEYDEASSAQFILDILRAFLLPEEVGIRSKVQVGVASKYCALKSAEAELARMIEANSTVSITTKTEE